MSDDAQWQAIRNLTYAVTKVAAAMLGSDSDKLRRLGPIMNDLNKIGKILAEHAAPGADEPSGPSTAELHEMVRDIAETVEEHSEEFERQEHDRSRPVHVTIRSNK